MPPHACLQPWVVQPLPFATAQVEAFDEFLRRDVQRLISQLRRDGKQFGDEQARLAGVQRAGVGSDTV
jgi:serine/threonine-protein kinase RIO1